MSEVERRREIQRLFNQANGIVPRSARSGIQPSLVAQYDEVQIEAIEVREPGLQIPLDKNEQQKLLAGLRQEMFNAAAKKEFERAAELRDRINVVQKELLKM